MSSQQYFDSGCSRHITGNKCLFSNYSDYSGGTITFRGEKKVQVTGKGTIEMDSFPKLTNMLYVTSSKANIISISQSCDDNHHVQFTQN